MGADRLGRKDNETPFVLKWFVEQGISVWSTVEGEQRFDSNVDDLLNYIRFWQASSESQKTSVRIKTRMKQIVEDGHYMGGTVPFGYRAVYKGRMNKKGRPVKDLEIDPREGEIVREIFFKVAREGYSAHGIARLLYDLLSISILQQFACAAMALLLFSGVLFFRFTYSKLISARYALAS